MKKILLVLTGLLFACNVSAETLIDISGQERLCSSISMFKAYKDIDCPGYKIDLQKDRKMVDGPEFIVPTMVKIIEVQDFKDGVGSYKEEIKATTTVQTVKETPVKLTREQILAKIQTIIKMIALLQAQLAAIK